MGLAHFTCSTAFNRMSYNRSTNKFMGPAHFRCSTDKLSGKAHSKF